MTTDDARPTYEGRPLAHPDEPLFDQGLAFDLETELSRRRVLTLIGIGGLGAGLLAIAGCAPSSASPAGAVASTAASSAGAGAATPGATTAAATAAPNATALATDLAACAVIPPETAGPFPGDGTNGPNVLTASGVVRRDITTSFGELSGTAEGVPLVIRLVIQDVGHGCAPIDGAAVYAWHCDRDGGYSLYSEGVTDQNYLRGVQEADADGIVEFATIFPGCYPGRWPHVHFEVYPSLDTATDESNRIATSQLALPEDTCAAAYAVAGYETSARNLGGVSLATDGVFRDDGGVSQLAAATGDASSGYTVELVVPVRA